MGPRILAGLLLLALAAPLASGETVGTLPASASPSTLEAAPGTRVATVLLLHNPLAQPVTLQMSYHSPVADKVSYDAWTVTIPAGERREVRATILTDANTTTARTLKLGGQDSAAGVKALAEVALKPIAPAAAARDGGLVRVVPLGAVELEPGGSASATFRLENDGDAALPATFQLVAPPGFAVRGLPGTLKVPARGSVDVSVDVRDERADPVAGTFRSSARIMESPASAIDLPLTVSAPAPPAPAAAEAPRPSTGAAPGLVAAGAILTGVGGTAAAIWAARRKWPWLFAALYTRLAPSKMLQSPMRARIVELVKANPGIAFSEIQRRLAIGAGTLTHHAHLLERSGILFSSPDGQQRRFYHVGGGYVAPKGSVGERAVELLARGPRSSADVARELGVSRQVLHYHIKKLVAEGKLRATQDGRDLQLALAAG